MNRHHHAPAYALILLCATLATLPLWQHGPSCGHDFDFHLQSWFAATPAWHHPLTTLHWLPAANYGAGEPRLLFYPPLSWLLGSALGTLLPWTLVPQAFTLLALAAAGLAFYTAARRSVRPAVAASAACLYLANPYLLFVGYERAAYGELLGAIFIPLVLLCTLRHRPPILPLACVIAALWFANAPAAVMGCYLAAFCATAAAIATRRLLPLLRTAAALAFGLALAAIYILPAWYQQRWVQITRAVGPGMRVEDSFLFAHTGEPFHDQVLHTASSIAVAILAAGLLSLGLHWLLTRATRHHPASPSAAAHPTSRPSHRLLSPTLAALLLLLLALLLPWSDPVWRLAPELRFLQFPWRWLLVAGVAATLALALLIDRLLPPPVANAGPPVRRQYASAAAALGLATTLSATAWASGLYAQHAFAQPCDDEDNVRAQQLLLPPDPLNLQATAAPAEDRPRPGGGFEGTDEYTPVNADNGEIQQGLPAVRLLAAPDADEGDDAKTPNPGWTPAAAPFQATIRITLWQPEHKLLTLTNPSAAYAVLRLLDYPAWQVRLNRHPISPRARLHREDGLLTLALPPGVNQLEITWQATPDVLAARALSAVSLCLLLALAAIRLARRLRSSDLPPRPSAR